MSGVIGDVSVTVQGSGMRGHGSADPSSSAIPRQGRRLELLDSGGETVPAQPQAVPAQPQAVPAASARAGEQSLSTLLRTWGLQIEVVLAFTVGVIGAFAMDRQPFPAPISAVAALCLFMLSNYHRGRAVTTPLTRQLRAVGQSTMPPLALLSVAVGFFDLHPATLGQTFAAVGAAAATSFACRAARWRLQAPVRVLVVGDRAAVATATARWARTPRVQVVAGLIMEPELSPDPAPQEVLGVPTVMGLDSADALVRQWRADLVVVCPGPGVTAEAFRRLTWSLEHTGVAIGVSGVLDFVAPHRITPGGIERTALLDVRPPRPSQFMRGLKAAGDRVGGLVLLAALAPLLLVMAAAVKLDSPGPAFFKQRRIGRGGRPFTVYKLRTMVLEAEALKTSLGELNEFDSVLFKMRSDPRVTRLGGFLRKSSLDELPQLINVVRGEMSLVGPRPFVPDEVERMQSDVLRRHAVQPGITGLWQVSGRSDLTWEEAAALDTYYADNWSLGGDVAILLRTVGAVIGSKGAY